WSLALRDSMTLNATRGKQRLCSCFAKSTAKEQSYVWIIVDDEDSWPVVDLVRNRQIFYVNGCMPHSGKAPRQGRLHHVREVVTPSPVHRSDSLTPFNRLLV